MPDNALEGVKVEQRHRDAAVEHYPPHLWRPEAIDDLAHAFARFEASLSHTRPAEPSEDEVESAAAAYAKAIGFTHPVSREGIRAAIAALKDRSDG